MNPQAFLDPHVSSRLCLTLLHSLWQVGTLVAVLWFIERVWRRKSLEWSYGLHVAALLLSLAALPITFLSTRAPSPTAEESSSTAIAQLPDAGSPAPLETAPLPSPGADLPRRDSHVVPAPTPDRAAAGRSAGQSTERDWAAVWLRVAPWLAGVYAGGVVLMFIRLFVRNTRAERLSKRAESITEGPLAKSLQTLCKRWSMRLVPALARAEQIVVPQVVGLLKPTILLPTSALSEMSTAELEMIIAHELAHVRRHDMWINLMQRLAEAVLFFNPMLWLLSRKTSTLREYCCDELTCREMSGSGPEPRMRYAEALVRVVELARPNTPKRGDVAALAAGGRSPSELRRRLARLLGEPLNEPIGFSRAGLLCLALLTLTSLGVPAISQSRSSEADETEATPNGASSDQRTSISGTGEPGASVKLYLYAHFDAKPVLKHETSVDSSGRFSVPEVPAVGEGGYLVIAATRSGRASVIYHVDPSSQNDVSLVMKPQTASLSGTVTDANGSPIAGAVVSVQCVKHPIPGVQMAKTDENGRYDIADLAPWKPELTVDPDTGMGTMVGECALSVSHPDYPTTRGAYSRIPQRVDVTLLPPAIVEGQVVDLVSGEPLPKVEVEAQGVARDEWYTTEADAEGKYQLRMTNDHYNIWAVAPDRMPLAIKALKVTQGRRLMGMDIRMTRGSFVVGQVIDPATNRPIDGSQTEVRVAHHGPARPRTGAAVTATRVKPDGTYRLHVAPGRNLVYLMSGNAAPVYLKVGDGQTVEHDFVIGSTMRFSPAPDPDELLGHKIRQEAHREDAKGATSPTSRPAAATLRGDNPAGRLLTELEDINAGPERYQDVWANQIRKIVIVGPDAVPELIEELDRTSNGMMLRCLGFILRAIDDQRAVPALIRAIPKTLRAPESDYGLRIEGTDVTLARFMRQHDLDADSTREKNEYGLGRPVREIFGALRSLTGQDYGEGELYSIYLWDDDFPGQRHAKAVLFHRAAERWAEWWKQHARELTDDPSLHDARLAPLPDPASTKSVPAGTRLKTSSGSSGWILESVRRAPGGQVFYDLDTGRAASVPEPWRNQELRDDKLREIQKWAAKEGYDMMGDEITAENGKPVFVLRPIGLQSWELPETRWKAGLEQTSIASLKAEGRANERDVLLHCDARTEETKPLATASFFYLTREGTPGILYVGIEVHDDSLQPGGLSTSDSELERVAFRKGRRFGLSRLVEAD